MSWLDGNHNITQVESSILIDPIRAFFVQLRKKKIQNLLKDFSKPCSKFILHGTNSNQIQSLKSLKLVQITRGIKAQAMTGTRDLTSIVVDNGSSTIKVCNFICLRSCIKSVCSNYYFFSFLSFSQAGFGGEDVPRVIFPNVIGRPHHTAYGLSLSHKGETDFCHSRF